jgi:hypothetical protein
MTPNIAEIGNRNLETLGAIQKQFLDAVTKANQGWLDYVNKEASLTSDLTKVLTNAKSVPEATAAFQEWTTKQIELITSHTRKVIEETQDFTQACAKIVSNEKGPD